MDPDPEDPNKFGSMQIRIHNTAYSVIEIFARILQINVQMSVLKVLERESDPDPGLQNVSPPPPPHFARRCLRVP